MGGQAGYHATGVFVEGAAFVGMEHGVGDRHVDRSTFGRAARAGKRRGECELRQGRRQARERRERSSQETDSAGRG